MCNIVIYSSLYLFLFFRMGEADAVTVRTFLFFYRLLQDLDLLLLTGARKTEIRILPRHDSTTSQATPICNHLIDIQPANHRQVTTGFVERIQKYDIYIHIRMPSPQSVPSPQTLGLGQRVLILLRLTSSVICKI